MSDNLMGGTLKILLVEDNPAHAEMTIRGLKSSMLENEIYHVEDGQEALDYLYGREAFSDRKTYPFPQIILLDLRLPKVDGLEVLRQIKGDTKLNVIPVIILTTSNAEVDTTEAYKYHANSYLVKPVDGEAFNKLINDFKTYWLGLNYQPPMKK